MAGYHMPNFNPEIDAVRKRGDHEKWVRLVGDRFASRNVADRVDALVEAHFAAETARDKIFRDIAAQQAIAMDLVMQQTPAGRTILTALKVTGKSGKTSLQEALDRKAVASGAAISPAHALIELDLRRVITRQPNSPRV